MDRGKWLFRIGFFRFFGGKQAAGEKISEQEKQKGEKDQEQNCRNRIGDVIGFYDAARFAQQQKIAREHGLIPNLDFDAVCNG